jgi:hypothetical protein
MSPFHASMLLSAPKLLLDVPFQQLLKQRNFDKIKAALVAASDESLLFWLYDTAKVSPPANNKPHANDEEVLADDSDEDDDDDRGLSLLTRETPLHRLVAVQPPVDVVMSLVQRLTTMFQNAPKEMTDVVGRTPLHVAMIFRCRSEVVRFLIQNSTAAVVQDAWLRCPLHWACTQPGLAIAPKSSSPRRRLNFMNCQPKDSSAVDKNDDMVLTVNALIRAFPEATLIRDCHGSTPLDLAIEHQADYRVVALVNSAAERLRISRKDIGESTKNHSDETSSTDVDSFPAGFPGEINLIHIPEEPEYEPRRSWVWSESFRMSSPIGYTRFEC